MITLITGTPGASKTLNTIKMVNETWGDSGRPIYYRGIKELTLPWTELNEEQCRKWYELPEGSVLVVDEAQQVWPNRSTNKEAPESVVRMDTHRHGGFDIYVLTQQPTMVDYGLRGFVGQHFHYERAFGRDAARQLEWSKSISDVNDYHKRQEAQITRVNFDKKYYTMYKSAEVHTVKKRIPKKFWLFVASCLFTVAAGAYAFNNIMGRTSEGDAPGQNDIAPETYGGISIGNNVSMERNSEPLSVEAYHKQWTPRIDDVPWSAPAYDELTEVKTFPKPQCIYFHKNSDCRCFTQQGTPLSISRPQCLNIVENGWFNPFKEEGGAEAGGQAQRPRSAPPVHTQQSPQIVYLDSGGNEAPLPP